MIEQPDSTLDEVVETYLRIFGALQQRNVTDWMELDLSTAQLKVLFMVNFRGPLPISKIAHIVGIGAPTASHLVEKLVQAGLLERIESVADRRVVHAQVTAEGRATAFRLRQGRVDVIRYWVSQLSADDQVALHKGLQALSQIAVSDLNHKVEAAPEAVCNEAK
ncbi:MAG: MarR family winged helix-turn-helix transcriptional regulator [Aggregatilineales bacterium]